MRKGLGAISWVSPSIAFDTVAAGFKIRGISEGVSGGGVWQEEVIVERLGVPRDCFVNLPQCGNASKQPSIEGRKSIGVILES